jgi:metallophosphoesterase (TIGR00282 family)
LLVLFIGDVVGRPGRECVGRLLPALRAERGFDLVVANGENAAGGFGLSPTTAEELFAAGVDVITLGNHTWAQKELVPYLLTDAPVARPLNYPPGTPGRGVVRARTRGGDEVAVLNLLGRVFMDPLDSPFRAADEALSDLGPDLPVIVDFHAEATSEKMALAHYLDGRVSAVLGTHTHVPTADARALPKGTLYLTDVGMVGPHDSVIGAEIEATVRRFVAAPAARPERPDRYTGPVAFNSVVLELDPSTGRGASIRRLDLLLQRT